MGGAAGEVAVPVEGGGVAGGRPSSLLTPWRRPSLGMERGSEEGDDGLEMWG